MNRSLLTLLLACLAGLFTDGPSVLGQSSLAEAQISDAEHAAAEGTAAEDTATEQSFAVMAWNIWHGGREDGEQVGPERVVDVIRDCGADIVAMQETYGSGELISNALKFHYQPRGTNVSIHSRFPILEDLSVFEEFKCVGALIELPNKRRVAFYSIWLPYNKEIWAKGTRDVSSPHSMLAACQASCDDLKKIYAAIDERLSDDRYKGVPLVIAGDFNSMSHLDYLPSFVIDHEVSLAWPTSQVLTSQGFRDSYRETNPEVIRQADRTWTPRFPQQQQDRIDFIYYRGAGLTAKNSQVIDTHAEKFPSDHAALVTRFAMSPARAAESTPADELRVVSYNIRHGAGTDNRLDLDRTSALLRNLRPDIVGLQEVDNGCSRSENVDQARKLGADLNLNSAFGRFMDYDGGKYGLGILSRYPILSQQEIRLPDGNEPRVALACEIELPDGRSIMAVNLHFDWVRDDTFRFAQAQVLAKYLDELKLPYLLLGDFNDVKGSRTLDLLARGALEAKKPAGDRGTFPSAKPRREIDFIFAAPSDLWELHHCRTFNAPVTSDHRPVLAVFGLPTTADR